MNSGPLICERPSYMRILEETLETPSIKVLSGIRRCGKSTLLRLFEKKLREKGTPSENIVNVRFDSFDVPLEPDAAWLDGL